MPDTEFSTIEEQARFLRGAFEHILQDAIGTRATAGSCLHAAILLSTILGKFAGASCQVCGGGPPMDGGALDKVGVLRGHYWVEGRTTSGQFFLADITADQFGYQKVEVLREPEARRRYFRGNAEVIAQHVEEEQASWPIEAPSP